MQSVRDVMQASPKVVSPRLRWVELERLFLREKVSGFPVVEEGKLVGIITRSDVVRHLVVEQSLSESVTTDDWEAKLGELDIHRRIDEAAIRVACRLSDLHVEDVMIRRVHTLSPEQTLDDAAQVFLEHHVHRAPVVDEEAKVVGIVSSLDLVAAFTLPGEGRRTR